MRALMAIPEFSRRVFLRRSLHTVSALAAVHGGDEVVRAEPFEAIELDLGALWSGTGAR